jgi:glycosyltransferase involved in cell wall biosynthesis
MSTVCAIVPTFNRSRMLKECLDSLLQQTRPPDQIIVVNDGSTDDTATMLVAYAGKMTVVNKENGGKASCLNVGLFKCQCDYVWICDDDDVAAPEGLALLAAALDTRPDLGFVFGKFMTFQDNDVKNLSAIPFWYETRNEKNLKILFLEEMIANQYATLVRKSLYDRVGPFNEAFIRSQDYEMALRLNRNANALLLSDVIFYLREHDGHRGALIDNFDITRKARKQLEYDQKIFRKVYEQYSLDEFKPGFAAAWKEPLAKRAALIERACVMARRALWGEAIADLRQASAIETPIAVEERHIAETVTDRELAWIILDENPQWVSGLAQIAGGKKNGRDLIIAMCRPLVWYIKMHGGKGEIKETCRYLALVVRILGFPGAARRAMLSLMA